MTQKFNSSFAAVYRTSEDSKRTEIYISVQQVNGDYNDEDAKNKLAERIARLLNEDDAKNKEYVSIIDIWGWMVGKQVMVEFLDKESEYQLHKMKNADTYYVIHDNAIYHVDETNIKVKRCDFPN